MSIKSPGRRQQCGAISIMAAVALALVIGAGLLAVDLGSLFYTKRELQTVADTAALSATNNLADAHALAVEIAAKNNFELPGSQQNTLSAIVGYYDAKNPAADPKDRFEPKYAVDNSNAVEVTVTTRQPYFFMFGSRELSALAIARRSEPIAEFSIGTKLVDLNTARSMLNGLLGGLLGTSVNLSVAGFEGLVNTSVTLLELIKAHGKVGTVEELLDLDLTVGELLELTAQALEQKNIAGLGATVADLNLLAMKTGGDLRLKMSDLLKVDLANGEDAVNVAINLRELVTMSAMVANDDHFIEIPGLGLHLPGLVDLDLGLTVIEAPSIAIGPPGQNAAGEWRTQAHSAQARLRLDFTVGKLLGGLVHLPLYIEAAAGDAWLEEVECNNPIEDSIVTIGAATSGARIYVGEVSNAAMKNRTKPPKVEKATLLNVLGLITATAKLTVDLPGVIGGTHDFIGPFGVDNTYRYEKGLTTVGLGEKLATDINKDTLKVTLLGLGLGLDDLAEGIVALLTPIFGLLDSVLELVCALLGIQLAAADVTAMDLSCGAPQLVR
ncbi:MAG: TadG family pilus assembly protein [Thiohalomonadaceae bacterium]